MEEFRQLLTKHGHITLCNWAAKNGRLDVLQLAREHGYPWDEWTCAYTALGGHLNILQWALENNCPSYPHVRVMFKNRHFTAASKLLHRNIFEKQDEVKEWIKTVNDACNTLTYNDLSKLIKSFI